MNRLYVMCLVTALVATSVVQASDWPAYMADFARSGITPQPPKPPLNLQWVFESPAPPAEGWGDPEVGQVWEYGLERVPKVADDDAFQPIAAEGKVFFASSTENKLYALDAATGDIKWQFYVDAPPRMAPTYWQGKLYLGADDGTVYCLNAADGELVWTFNAGLDDDRAVGQGRIMSLWPVRTGILVDRGVAYFAAGMFPIEGMHLYAVNADNGDLIWINDKFDDAGQANVSPQGYLLADESKLFMPSGRVGPLVFDRATGELLYSIQSGRGLSGGTYAMLSGDFLFNGSGLLGAYDRINSTRDKYNREVKYPNVYSWFQGRRIIIKGNISYLALDDELLAIPVDAMQEAAKVVDEYRAEQWKHRNSGNDVKRYEQELENPDLPADRRQRTQNSLQQAMDKYAPAMAARERMNEHLDRVCRWRLPGRYTDSMILAGGVLLAGADGQVAAVDAASGRLLGTFEIKGRARGLAVADGRLFVSTTLGNIYGFGSEPVPGGKPAHVLATPVQSPYSNDNLSPLYEKFAQDILTHSGITEGFCLILGGDDGRLAYELARRSQLRIYVVEQDKTKVAQARNAISAAGLYGHRVVIEQGSLKTLDHPAFFANLIVCQESIFAGKISTPAEELVRVLRPEGGKTFIGQPGDAAAIGSPLDADALQYWLGLMEEAGCSIQAAGEWKVISRGKLNGSGQWTHLLANPANTVCSDDMLVKAPLGILWFGQPGPREMINRHSGGTSPLSFDGRLYVAGRKKVMAFDAYNGLPLWERDFDTAGRTNVAVRGGNFVGAEESIFLAVSDQCIRMNALTGETTQTYTIPLRPDKAARHWGYLAVLDGILLGSRTKGTHTRTGGDISESLFAIDLQNNRLLWELEGEDISHQAIAADDGVVFIMHAGVSQEQKEQALAENSPARRGDLAIDRTGRPLEPQVRLVQAVELSTGRILWARAIDVSDCVIGPQSRPSAGGELSLTCKDKVLLLSSAPWNGHFLQEWSDGKFSRRSIIALNAETGDDLWASQIGYRSRPLVIGNTIYAEPWAFDLNTGRPRMSTNPITGIERKWEMWRGYAGCGPMAGTGHGLIFKQGGAVGFYDISADSGILNSSGHRPACWINFITANGLLLVPEGSSQCDCALSIQGTMVFYPRKTARSWNVYNVPDSLVPVQHIGINIGAPGDWRDEKGVLWLSCPNRVKKWHWLGSQFLNAVDAGYVFNRSLHRKLDDGDKAVVAASYGLGIRQFSMPVTEKDKPGVYTLRLLFIEPESLPPGKRIFNVSLQGKQVLANLDIAGQAGGGDKPLVREFKGVQINGSLTIDLAPSARAPDSLPVLCGVEILRER